MLVQEPITGLWHDPSIEYPINYRYELVSLDELIRRELGVIGGPCLPEFRLRLVNVLIWHQGNMGVGDGWRPCPSNTSAASLRCESFHQNQRYRDGRSWWSGADMVVRGAPGQVHKTPPTADIPVQGTPAAVMFGIHANVGSPGSKGFESWHAQCIEQDGQQTWVMKGRQYPDPNYPFPVLHQAPVPPKPDPPKPDPKPEPEPIPIGDIDMIRVDYGIPGTDWWWARTLIAGNTITWVQGLADKGLDKLVPGHIQVESDQHMMDLLSTYRAIGEPPSTWLTNSTLVAAWYASAAK